MHLDGIMPPASYPKVLKLDDWKQVVPGLMVKGGKVGCSTAVQRLHLPCRQTVSWFVHWAAV